MTNTPTGPGDKGQIAIPKSKRGFKGFWIEVAREMRKVTWPATSETNRLTWVVLGMCTLITLALLGMSKVAEIAINVLTHGRIG